MWEDSSQVIDTARGSMAPVVVVRQRRVGILTRSPGSGWSLSNAIEVDIDVGRVQSWLWRRWWVVIVLHVGKWSKLHNWERHFDEVGIENPVVMSIVVRQSIRCQQW